MSASAVISILLTSAAFIMLLRTPVGATAYEVINCSLKLSCSGPNDCAEIGKLRKQGVRITPRGEEHARFWLPSGHYLEMTHLSDGPRNRRDWVINYLGAGYTGLVTVFENGELALVEHSQDKNGLPLISFLSGECEGTE